MNRTRTITLKQPEPPPIIDDMFGAYRVIAPLGRGASAEVYLGQHCVTGERVAIKVLDRRYCHHGEIAARLLGEHAIASLCRHPGLLETHDAGYNDLGIAYVVMEFLDGESLQSLIDRSDLSLDAIVMIGSQIAAAMAAAHTAGIIHCDIKPANIYVMYEPGLAGWPKIKVVDYGVARHVAEAPLPDGEIAGTPSFMAPEQWQGEPHPKSDVYALGCLLFELVTGEPLFSGTLPKLMLQHCEQLPDRPSARRAGVPAELERLIVRALAKDPAMRPTMAELESDLARMIGASPEAWDLEAAC